MAYIIIREDGNLGPFNEHEVAEFVASGLVLIREKCYDTLQPGSISTVGDILRSKGISTKVKQSGSLFSQLKTIGSKLLFPKTVFSSEPWKSNRRLLLMAIVGLSLFVLMYIPAGVLPDIIIFYVISLYFAIIWGLFFYYLFCTEQVKLKPTILTIFATEIIVQVVWSLPFIGLLQYSLGFDNVLGCIIGIGIPEELAKLAIVLIILAKSKEVLTPATMVYYGLMSGIAFGIFEGVEYQTGPYYEHLLADGASLTAYSQIFLLNIARLTSLPFLHAIWCGIGSYFAACSWVFPHYKTSLITLAILIPALLHGLYDYLCFNNMGILSIAVVFLSVILLMVYLASHNKLEQKLR